MEKKRFHLILYFVIISLIYFINADDVPLNLFVGDRCNITGTDETGIVKYATECPSNETSTTTTTISSNTNNIPIVCCPYCLIATSKSARMCCKYSEYVYNVIVVRRFGRDITEKNDMCPRNLVSLISDGAPAILSEFPHSALVGSPHQNGSMDWFCGGTLVSSRYVLTAAHCVTSKRLEIVTKLLYVRLGELVLLDDFDGANPINVAVEKIIPHPSYNRRKKEIDIALLKLDKEVSLSVNILPICLPESSENPSKALVTGWGDTGTDGAKSNSLLKAKLDLYSNNECKKTYPNIVLSQICAGSQNGKNDTCKGDSGGPLQIYHPNLHCMYTQVGITSYGSGGCGENVAGIYTKVHNYVEWIESHIWPK